MTKLQFDEKQYKLTLPKKILEAIGWKKGDEIVLFENDFPANVQPWKRLAAKGVLLRWVPMQNGEYDLKEVEKCFTKKTRLIATNAKVDAVAAIRMAMLCS